MLPSSVAAIIDTIQKNWRVSNDIEITLEANPTSVENEKLLAFRQAGVNRLSLGVQALNDDDLAFLGRKHSSSEALKAIDLAAHHFPRYSFDLIYARPNQSLKAWEVELKRAISLAAGHLSIYQLTIEERTPFYRKYSRGEFTVPDEVAGAEFFHLTQDIMEGAGLPAYEVSNHAREGQECRHNLIYWHMADYIGIGAGAHGRFMNGDNKYASSDEKVPERWFEQVNEQGHGSDDFELLSPQDRFYEAVMTGLRLREGVSLSRCEAMSGLEFADIIDMDKVNVSVEQGWMAKEKAGDHLRLTREGMLRLNAILPYILK